MTAPTNEVHFLRRAFTAPFRGAPGSGSGLRSTSDLEEQLRQRLRFLAVFGETSMGILLSAEFVAAEAAASASKTGES